MGVYCRLVGDWIPKNCFADRRASTLSGQHHVVCPGPGLGCWCLGDLAGKKSGSHKEGPSTGGDPHVINFVIPATNELIVNALRSAAKVF